MASGLVRDVVERHTSAPPVPPQGLLDGSSKTGFPAVHHRSKAVSAFKRARQDDRVQSGLSESRERLRETVYPSVTPEDATAGSRTPRPAEDWIKEISRTNEEAVANTSADEIAHEREDIVEKFGPGIEDLMAKVREARERRAARHVTPDSSSNVISVVDSTPSSPRARATRKIRFAEPTEADVHVYESQPSSPKRALALLPPPENLQERGEIMSLGSFKGTVKTHNSSVEPSPSSHGHSDLDFPEEGTPEDIRRRFFPSEVPPEANPALAWMLPTTTPPTGNFSPDPDVSLQQGLDVGSIKEPRFSLSGTLLSPAEVSNLPTHLGLHHHATSSSSSDALAGYTLSDLLLLSRSSVPAQRASVLGVLAKLLRNTREQHMQYVASLSGVQDGLQDVVDPSNNIDLDAMRRDLLDAAIDALGEKGGVGLRGVELLWEAIVGFIQMDYGVDDMKGLAHVDLTPKRSAPRPSTSSPRTLSSKSSSKSPTPNTPRQPPDILMSLPVSTILPMLRQHLIASPSTMSRTHTQVLEILLVLSHFASHAQAIVHPDAGHGMVAAILEPHLRPSFGSLDDESDETRPSPTSIHILQALARSSRDNATILVGPADVLLRYLTEPHSPLTSTHHHSAGHSSSRLSTTLLEDTLLFYDILSQYGLYSQIATIAQDHFTRIGAWILDAMRNALDPALAGLARAYVSLLKGLIVCATDPHQTTPSHDILWSQVQGWGWANWTMELAELLASTPETSSQSYALSDVAIQGLWADILNTTAAWMEGASVNGVRGGEVERSAVLGRLRPLLEVGRGANAMANALATLRAWGIPSASNAPNLHTMAQAASLVGATTRFLVACHTAGAIGEPFHIHNEEIQALCIRFASSISSQGPFTLLLGQGHRVVSPETSHAYLRPLLTLMVFQLKLWSRSMVLETGVEREASAQCERWTMQALHVLRALLPGDENHAQWIIECMCDIIDPDFVHKTMSSTELPSDIWEKEGLKVLLPFLTSSLRPASAGGEEKDQNHPIYIAPIWSTPQSISRCTTLNIPSVSHMQESWDSDDPDAVLPLRNDWPTLPLNHLLRSGTSPVFRALPSSWDASETDVVRASLLLSRIVQEMAGKESANMNILCMSSAQVVFSCMKVFMLEHGQQQLDSGEEVFRDMFVTRWMGDLLKPYTYSHSRRRVDDPPSLEQVSKAFLGGRTPFYQFYTDFLALYDAISFSHALFARLLLPPVSMSYPIDYRKLLFGDFGHVVRTVKTDVPDLLCSDVRDYLWPVERDTHVIGWYLKSLVTSHVHGFLRWLAVHHVAGNIWPEFISGHPTGRESAGKLMGALLQQGNNDIVREIALYRQREDEVWAPPNCFMSSEMAWRRARLEWVQDVGGSQAMARLQGLFLEQ